MDTWRWPFLPNYLRSMVCLWMNILSSKSTKAFACPTKRLLHILRYVLYCVFSGHVFIKLLHSVILGTSQAQCSKRLVWRIGPESEIQVPQVQDGRPNEKFFARLACQATLPRFAEKKICRVSLPPPLYSPLSLIPFISFSLYPSPYH